jgi:outer membrane protein OmpA-like peptidoglycan-associated protein
MDMHLESPRVDAGLFDTIAHFIGGSPDATKKTYEATMPTAMYSLAQHGSTESGAQGLLDGLRSGKLPQLDAQDLGRTLADPQASDRLMTSSGDLLERLLGGRLGGLLDALSSIGGLGRGGSSKLLALAAPLALGVIDKVARHGNLGARGLSGLLASQMPQLAEKVPPSIARTLGLGAEETYAGQVEARPKVIRADQPRAREAFGRAAPARARGERRPGWMLLTLVALLGLGWLLSRSLRHQPPQVAVPTPTVPAPSFGRRPTPVRPAPAEQRLALTSESSAIRSIQSYLAGQNMQPQRFVLDGLTFDKDRSELNAGGRQVTNDLAALLKEHPETKVRIEGFTDATGPGPASIDLSADRARAVKQRLMELGVSGDRIDAAGLGDSKPIAPNDTEEGRARNRRIEVVLTR